jgi:hypothetical protein
MKTLVSYDRIVNRLETYWESISRLSAKKPETIAYSLTFLTEDFTIRHGDIPLESSGKEMIQGIAFENDNKWRTQIKPSYLIVDERNQRAAACFYEQLVDIRSGKTLRESSYFTHMKYLIESGLLKIQSEHMVEVPSKFKLDSLKWEI